MFGEALLPADAQIGSPWWSSALQALVWAVGGAAIWYAARQVEAPAWYEWLVVPAAFLATVLSGIDYLYQAWKHNRTTA